MCLRDRGTSRALTAASPSAAGVAVILAASPVAGLPSRATAGGPGSSARAGRGACAAASSAAAAASSSRRLPPTPGNHQCHYLLHEGLVCKKCTRSTAGSLCKHGRTLCGSYEPLGSWPCALTQLHLNYTMLCKRVELQVSAAPMPVPVGEAVLAHHTGVPYPRLLLCMCTASCPAAQRLC